MNLLSSPAKAPGASPPGPSSRVFGFDLLRETRQDYLGHVERLHLAYGDIVKSQVVHETIFDVHHPDLIRQLLVDNADALIRWERGMQVFAAVHGQSVLVTEGERWKRQRHMLQPGFSAKRMASYATLMCEATASALSSLHSAPVQLNGQIKLEFLHWAKQLTMDVILKTLFGSHSLATHDAALRDHMVQATALLAREGMKELFFLASWPDWMPHKAAKRKAKQLLDNVIRSQISARRQSLEHGSTHDGDVLSMLFNARDEAGLGLSDLEIRDQCMTIFLAGHDTSATALSWWAWLMATHPEHAQKAQQQVDSVLQGRAPGYNDMVHLPYLAWSLKEAMRLYPPAASLLSRRTLREVQLTGCTIPKGAMVRVTPWLVQRDARWFADPLQFKPERFDESQNTMHRQSYMPFGSGPRMCIGSLFAMTEMTLIAAHLLQRFTLSTQSAPQPRLEVLLSPVGGVQLNLSPRHFNPSQM